MLKDQKKNKEIREFIENNNDLLIMIADPKTDEFVISFGGQFAVVQFPFERMEDGIVFNALSKSKFQDAIDPLMSGIESIGIKVEDNQQFSHIIGGSIKSIGEKIEEQRSLLPTKKKRNAKKN